MRRALGGSLCMWSRRLPHDFADVHLALRDAVTRVQLIVCAESRHTKPYRHQHGKPRRDRQTIGVTILPDDQLVRRIIYKLDAEAIKRAGEAGLGFIRPTLVGCVDYQFEFSPGHHQTGFVDEVFRADKDHLDSEFASAIWPGVTDGITSHFLIMPASTINDVVLEPAPIEPSYSN
jgi:hypothetical protein